MKVSAIMTSNPITVSTDCTLDQALQILEEQNIRHLPVVDRDEIVGLVSDRDILDAVGGLPSRMHACRGPGAAEEIPGRVGEIMSKPVISAAPEDSITSVAIEMLHRRIGCLPIVRAGKLVGIVTEIDLLNSCVSGPLADHPGNLGNDPVENHMTSCPTSVTPQDSLGHAIALSEANSIRHLPVIAEEHLLGIVSDRDLRRAVGVGRHKDMPLGDLMTWDPVSVSPSTSLSKCAEIMARRRISSLPVLYQEECAGILTLADVLEGILDADRPRAEPSSTRPHSG